MKKNALKFILFGMAFFIAGSSLAQTVIAGQQITGNVSVNTAYMDSNNPTITLTFSTPVQAGDPVAAVSNSDLFVRLSVAIWNYGHYHNIGYLAAAITSGSVPPGTVLTLVSAPCTTTNSGGALGTPTAPITLSTTYQPIVTTMGNCYTGTGDMDGYQMTFTLEPSTTSYGQIVAGSTYSVSVTFEMFFNQ